MIILAILSCFNLLILATAASILLNSTLLSSTLPVPEPPFKPYYYCGEGLGGAFTIESDVYLVHKNSVDAQHYNAQNGTFSEPLNDYKSLFDKVDPKTEISTVQAIVPLSGFCLKSPLCTDSSWNELEKLVIVHGKVKNLTKWPYTDFTGFLLAARNTDADRKFKLLTEETVSLDVLEKLSELDLIVTNDPFNQLIDDSKLLPIPFESMKIPRRRHSESSCLGAVFVPSRAEMLVLIDRFSKESWSWQADFGNLWALSLYRQKFNASGSEGSKWERLKLSDMKLDRDVRLVGLISIGEKVHAVGWDSELFDIEWDDNDKISVKRTNKTRLINDCRVKPPADHGHVFATPSSLSEQLKHFSM